ATSIDEAKDFFRRHKSWTLVVADYHQPDGNGWDLCSWIRDHAESTPFLLTSASPHCATLCAGADYLPKPFPPEKLESYVRSLPGGSGVRPAFGAGSGIAFIERIPTPDDSRPAYEPPFPPSPPRRVRSCRCHRPRHGP